MAGLMSYESAERIRRRLMNALRGPVFDPALKAPTVERVRGADKWIWYKLASLCPRGLRAPGLQGLTPADKAVEEILTGPPAHELAQMLGPIPKSPGEMSGSKSNTGSAAGEFCNRLGSSVAPALGRRPPRPKAGATLPPWLPRERSGRKHCRRAAFP